MPENKDPSKLTFKDIEETIAALGPPSVGALSFHEAHPAFRRAYERAASARFQEAGGWHSEQDPSRALEQSRGRSLESGYLLERERESLYREREALAREAQRIQRQNFERYEMEMIRNQSRYLPTNWDDGLSPPPMRPARQPEPPKKIGRAAQPVAGPGQRKFRHD